MNVNSSTDAAMATLLNQSQNDTLSMALLKKAIDLQAQSAQSLIEALPQPAAVNLPPNLGQNINTTA